MTAQNEQPEEVIDFRVYDLEDGNPFARYYDVSVEWKRPGLGWVNSPFTRKQARQLAETILKHLDTPTEDT